MKHLDEAARMTPEEKRQAARYVLQITLAVMLLLALSIGAAQVMAAGARGAACARSDAFPAPDCR
ncbi:MAG TPA: hypothetical protein VJQ79_13255 [Acidimicrobiia bacterium]|nr:hypothetical protein [Acidimicrobiia bacterium]